MPDRRSAVFIDGPNLHSTSKALGFEVDFKRLLAELPSWPATARLLLYDGLGRG